ncbi:hypothetical protein ABZ297_03965 [Nonomuraea sp. NPDC005983]|uniref:hypothetical protein n=1 Tax=Nonomuraea sp. NPDC005983 TaxID=3155595 RepID=UPI0033A6F6CC
MAEEQRQPADNLVTTQHALADGRPYTATTGTVVLREEVTTDGRFDGHRPKAEVFVTAYTLDGADPLTRPVTFAFNGGPGSSSVWLHLGVLGPRRVLMGDAGALADHLQTRYGMYLNGLMLISTVLDFGTVHFAMTSGGSPVLEGRAESGSREGWPCGVGTT